MTYATIAKPVSRPVPFTVANALSTLEQPSRFGGFLQAYGGRERAEFEWEGSRVGRAERQAKAHAENVISASKTIAEKNGWDWSEVVAAAREDHPELF